MKHLKRLRAFLEAWFPDRHFYIRQGGAMHAFVLSGRKQMAFAAGVVAAALWMGVCTASMLAGLFAGEREIQVAEPESAGPSPLALAATVERRHAALALLLVEASTTPGAAQALGPSLAQALAAQASGDPVSRLQAVQASQERVLAAADAFAASRTERLRTALRLAGVAPPPAPRPTAPVGGPLIEAGDARALGSMLDIDPAFAQRLQRTADDLAEANALTATAARLPIAAPTEGASRSSGFGFRIDPFTGRSAFHPGMDFAGARMTPVRATAPGKVTFTGLRSGYGRTVEVDHGGGFKTRYAHLASIGVRPGQQVDAGAKLGGMGSTGRSTGTHLHYEVWMNGRVQNPDRFVRAGTYAFNGG